MWRVPAVAALAALVVTGGFIGGCASIAGLTQFSDGDCNGGDCDASTGGDAAADGGATDGNAGDGGLSQDVVTVDTGTTDAQGSCGSCPGGCCSGTACVPFASQSTTSCGAGGAACAACPNGCCPAGNGGACGTQHDNGVGQSYYDCNPAYSSSNPWTVTAALEACAAFTKDATKCTTGWKCGTSSSVCSSKQTACDCWEYAGSLSGHVNTAGNCDCVLASDPTWD